MHNEVRDTETAGSGKTVREEGISRRRPWLIMLLAWPGIAGPAFSIAIAWLLPLVSEYTLIGDNISELAIGRYGYLQTAAFVAAGVGSLAVAVGVVQNTRGSWDSRLGSGLVGLWGVCTILVAMFPTDRIDSPADLESLMTVSIIHNGIALVSFISAIAGMFVLSWTFKRDTRWRALWPVCLALAFAALISIFLQDQGPWVGLYQRIFVGTITLWLIVVALRLRSLANDAAAARHATQEKAGADV